MKSHRIGPFFATGKTPSAAREAAEKLIAENFDKLAKEARELVARLRARDIQLAQQMEEYLNSIPESMPTTTMFETQWNNVAFWRNLGYEAKWRRTQPKKQSKHNGQYWSMQGAPILTINVKGEWYGLTVDRAARIMEHLQNGLNIALATEAVMLGSKL